MGTTTPGPAHLLEPACRGPRPGTIREQAVMSISNSIGCDHRSRWAKWFRPKWAVRFPSKGAIGWGQADAAPLEPHRAPFPLQ
jgi:hypothetical protein